MKQFKASEIHDNQNVEFMWVADPQYGGTAYCGPRWFYGSENPLYRLANSAKGLPWKEVPITFEGSSGSLWSQNNYHFQQSEILRGRNNWEWLKQHGSEGIETNLMGAWATASGALASWWSGESYENIMKNVPANMDPINYQNAKEKAAYLQSQVVAPDLSCAPAHGLQSFIQNGFDIIKLMPTNSDLENINNFFIKYGYAVPNLAFNSSMLSTRSDFNYIEVSDVEIVSATNNAGRKIMEAAAAQLEGGCRIWHQLPSVS